MHEDDLGTHVEQLFKQALAQTARRTALNTLHNALQEAQLRLQQPMRVAIVGVIKAGKSTMMNALLGETVVATGIVEATFNINWLKYDKKASLLVHFKDERPPEPKSLAELEQLTRRAEVSLDYLLGIKYIEVFHPNPLLRTLNLIDTPGLASFYQEDARNTLEFLRLHGQELTEATNQERDNADAVLYLFSHSLGAEEKALVEQFQGPQIGHTTPINSIGVLTKVDMFWSEPEYPDALAAGNEIIETLQNNHPRLRNIFYTIVPVCGSMAWGIQTITTEEFTVLQQISLLPEARLRKLLANLGRFTNTYPDISIDPEKREKLLRRLGGYGIWRACRLLRSGLQDRNRLEQALLQESGLPTLRHLIVSHFGKRAYLIKLASALREIKTACWSARQSDFVFPADKAVVRHIDDQFGRLEDEEPGFSELTVLRDYYQGKLPFTEVERAQLLQITGEYGLSPRQRLGLADEDGEMERDAWQEVLSTARKRAGYWRSRVIDPGANRETKRAARILGDAYDRLCYLAMQQVKGPDS